MAEISKEMADYIALLKKERDDAVKDLGDERMAKSTACQRVAELERELAETRAKLIEATPLRLRWDAERAVLDAMSELPSGTINAYLDSDQVRMTTRLENALLAELVRRGEKP